MQLTDAQMRLYAITDDRWLNGRTLYDCVEDALKGGVTMLQIRENDDVQAAKDSGADGVHVGQDDTSIAQARAVLGAGKWIGTSAHNVAEARKAQQDGADYIGTGAVFGSATKQDATPLSLQTLQEICQAVTIPVVAIGGITAGNALQLRGFGGQGIAVISAIFAKLDCMTAAGTAAP